MTLKDTYNFLEGLDMVNVLLETKYAEREQIATIATKTTAGFDDMPHGSGTTDKVGEGAIKLQEMTEEIEDTIEFMVDYKKEITGYLERLTADKYYILHSFYVQNLQINQICEGLARLKNRDYITRQWVSELKKRGVKELSGMIEYSDNYNKLKRIKKNVKKYQQ